MNKNIIAAEKTNYIFVYGTLRSDIGAHNGYAKMLRDASDFSSKATTLGVLYDVGSFPAIVKGEKPITGEIYHVRDDAAMDTLVPALDRYESNGSLYQREIVDVMADGTAYRAWCYFFLRSVTDLKEVISGDYADRK